LVKEGEKNESKAFNHFFVGNVSYGNGMGENIQNQDDYPATGNEDDHPDSGKPHHAG
jgi:hypothetical protein